MPSFVCFLVTYTQIIDWFYRLWTTIVSWWLVLHVYFSALEMIVRFACFLAPELIYWADSLSWLTEVTWTDSIRSPELTHCGCSCSSCSCLCHCTMKTDSPKLQILLGSQGMNTHCGCVSQQWIILKLKLRELWLVPHLTSPPSSTSQSCSSRCHPLHSHSSLIPRPSPAHTHNTVLLSGKKQMAV